MDKVFKYVEIEELLALADMGWSFVIEDGYITDAFKEA